MRPDPRLLDPGIFPFALAIAPRFGDMDSLRHINNVALSQYHQETRSNFHAGLFGVEMLTAPDAHRLVVANMDIAYLREAFFPGVIDARCGVKNMGTSSYVLTAALFQHGHCICIADTVMVHLARDGKAPLPTGMRARLERNKLLLEAQTT